MSDRKKLKTATLPAIRVTPDELEIITKARKIKRVPTMAEYIRQLILLEANLTIIKHEKFSK